MKNRLKIYNLTLIVLVSLVALFLVYHAMHEKSQAIVHARKLYDMGYDNAVRDTQLAIIKQMVLKGNVQDWIITVPLNTLGKAEFEVQHYYKMLESSRLYEQFFITYYPQIHEASKVVWLVTILVCVVGILAGDAL